MCKWLRDILFPLNLLGKKKRSFEVPVQSPPYNNVPFTVVWSGDRLDMCYASLFKRGKSKVIPTPIRAQYTNGNMDTETFIVNQRASGDMRTWVNAVYFNCTNVTYLEINGTQYI